MASVFDEILSETVHFSTEPAGTSCSADARDGDAARRRENVSMSLLFMGTPETTRAQLSRVRLLLRLQHSDAQLASAPAPIELVVEAEIEEFHNHALVSFLASTFKLQIAPLKLRRRTSISHADAPLRSTRFNYFAQLRLVREIVRQHSSSATDHRAGYPRSRESCCG
jgi:hypothetical protein